jgi:hypothetical protein
LAESLVKVNSGHIINSILNTIKQDVEVPKPVVKFVELRGGDAVEAAVIGAAEQEKRNEDQDQSREERVIAKMRTDRLNSGEKKSLCELCLITKMCSSCRGTN